MLVFNPNSRRFYCRKEVKEKMIDEHIAMQSSQRGDFFKELVTFFAIATTTITREEKKNKGRLTSTNHCEHIVIERYSPLTGFLLDKLFLFFLSLSISHQWSLAFFSSDGVSYHNFDCLTFSSSSSVNNGIENFLRDDAECSNSSLNEIFSMEGFSDCKGGKKNSCLVIHRSIWI